MDLLEKTKKQKKKNLCGMLWLLIAAV